MVQKKIKICKDTRLFYLGRDKDNISWFLEEPHWDCDWYWGFGYLNGFRLKTRYASFLSHYDSEVLSKYIILGGLLKECVLTEEEQYLLSEYMRCFYILQKFSDLAYSGRAGISTNEISDFIKTNFRDCYNKINKIILPKIFALIEQLLVPEKYRKNEEYYRNKINNSTKQK